MASTTREFLLGEKKTCLVGDAYCHDLDSHVLYAQNFSLEFIGIVRWNSVRQKKYHVLYVGTHSIRRVEQPLSCQAHSVGCIGVLASESQCCIQSIDHCLLGCEIC